MQVEAVIHTIASNSFGVDIAFATCRKTGSEVYIPPNMVRVFNMGPENIGGLLVGDALPPREGETTKRMLTVERYSPHGSDEDPDPDYDAMDEVDRLFAVAEKLTHHVHAAHNCIRVIRELHSELFPEEETPAT